MNTIPIPQPDLEQIRIHLGGLLNDPHARPEQAREYWRALHDHHVYFMQKEQHEDVLTALGTVDDLKDSARRVEDCLEKFAKLPPRRFVNGDRDISRPDQTRRIGQHYDVP